MLIDLAVSEADHLKFVHVSVGGLCLRGVLTLGQSLC